MSDVLQYPGTGDDEDDGKVTVWLACGVAPRELTEADRERMRARMLEAAAAINAKATADGIIILRGADVQWRETAPGVAVKVLRLDPSTNTQTALVRMAPGSQIAAHSHAQEEECLILEGEIRIGNHRVGAGDMHIGQAGYDHVTINTPAGALLLVRSEIRP